MKYYYFLTIIKIFGLMIGISGTVATVLLLDPIQAPAAKASAVYTVAS